MPDFHKEFISFCIEQGVLTFGSFVTKSGRETPYFFNAGLFNTGAALDRLTQFYAKAILDSGVSFDMLFGPAYKGIALVAGVSIALARGVDGKPGRSVPYAFNRKEAKDHGEGGSTIGAAIAGRVLIIDDVITAGTAVRESVAVIQRAGASVAGVVISMDRMERGQSDLSAVQEVERSLAVPVVAIASLDDLMAFLQDSPEFRQNMAAIRIYRQHFGVLT
ncbi:MAG: orotate phosphoribosyltransferase [Betaproteobacteria bacterium]|nr:orotate phosphoribosyltransferase [Betaproteobacteria bacterium]